MIPVARGWRALSVLSGGDASWGVLGSVKRLMGISEAELQEPGSGVAVENM